MFSRRKNTLSSIYTAMLQVVIARIYKDNSSHIYSCPHELQKTFHQNGMLKTFSYKLVPLCFALGGLLLGNTAVLYAQSSIEIISPNNGQCISEYAGANRFEGGILNGGIQGNGEVSVEVQITDAEFGSLTVHLNAGPVEPKYPQASSNSCSVSFTATFEERVAACNGQGYCVFSGLCICATNDDCSNGAGTCREDSTCGCSQDAQCGVEEICNVEGDCECGANEACALGESCLDNGACTCATNEDCGGDLFCVDNVCSQFSDYQTTIIDVPERTFNDPNVRQLNLIGTLSSQIQDGNNINLEVQLIDPNAFPVDTLDSKNIYFKLDRSFPLLNTTNVCDTDVDCTIPGEACDPVLFRCSPADGISDRNCREPEPFAPGDLQLPPEYEIVDSLDENPTFEILPLEVNGCNTHQKILLSDSCGNEQIVNIITTREPNDQEIQATYAAFRCLTTPCETEFKAAKLRSTRYVPENNGIVNAGPYDLSTATTLLIGTSNSNETVTFQANQFINPAQATATEVAAVINNQSSLLTAEVDQEALVLISIEIGEDAVLAINGNAAEPLGFFDDEDYDISYNISNSEARGFSPVVLIDGEGSSRLNIQTQITAREGCYDYIESQISNLDEQGNIIDNTTRNLAGDEILQALPASLLSTRSINGQTLHGGPFVSLPASLLSARFDNGSIVATGPYALSAGEILSFTVNGEVDDIVFNADDFNNIIFANASEVVDVINRESELLQAVVQNNAIFISTIALGSNIDLVVGGNAAADLGFANDPANGISNGQAQGTGLFDGATLVFEVNNEFVETITFNAINFFNIHSVRTVELVAQINTQSSEVNAFLEDIALRIETKRLGSDVNLQVSGTAATALGFTDDVEANISNSSALGSGNGNFRASLAVYACGDEVPIISDSLDVSVSAELNFEIGGPYVVDQGDELNITALAVVPIEFGGIKRIEWDLDGNGSFDADEPSFEFIDPVGTLGSSEEDASLVTFDTSENGEFFISCRITTNQADAFELSTLVTVNDVDPVCNLPQDRYIAREGDLFTIEASVDSGASDENDPIVEYQWTFGDLCPDPNQEGQEVECSLSTLDPSTQHIYREEGEYQLTFKAIDIDSECPQAATAIVEVTGVAPIIEDIGLNPFVLELQEGSSTAFTKGNTRAGAGTDPITAYAWELTNLDTAEVVNFDIEEPEYTFDTHGEFRMCLSVSDSDDQVGPVCFNFTVNDLQPRPTWTVQDGVLQKQEGQAFTFDATGTVAGGESDQLTGLRWEFSDPARPGDPNSNVIETGPDQMEVTYVFNGDGDFMVRVTAIDEDSEAFYENQVTILDVNPVAQLVVIYPDDALIGLENQPITLDASGSFPGAETDPIREYVWNFGDNSVERVTNQPTTIYEWPDGPALYGVSVTVRDQDSISSANLTLDIANVDPIVSISARDPSVEVGYEALFTMNVDDVILDRPGTSDQPVVIEWDMGDGTRYEGQDQVTHTFLQEGQILVTVRYEDGDGGEGEAELPYTIDPKRAEIDPAQVRVNLREGGEAFNPTTPTGDFREEEEDGETFYIYEGDEIIVDALIRSARLSNGTLDPANAVWTIYPEGATPSYVPVLPSEGQDNAGEEEKIARLVWQPSYFQAGTYVIRLLATGEITEGESTREWRIKVSEGGTPMLAGTTGSLRRGRVVLYEYGKENDRLTFTPNREIEVGGGAYKIVAQPNSSRLFVSAPGSGHVAVLDGNPMQVVRFIPTGAGAYDMVWGDGYLWVVNVQASTLSIIDPATLKVYRTVTFQDKYPTTLLWVGQPHGLETSYLLMGDARDGRLSIYGTTQLLRGEVETALESDISLGTSLNHMTIFNDQLVVSDAKKRYIYHADLATVINDGNAQAFTTITEIPFMLQDMQAGPYYLWLTTGNALYQVRSGFEIQALEYPTQKLAILSSDALESPGIVLSNGSRLDNYTLDESLDLVADPVHGIDGNRVQSLTFYIDYKGGE
jgi:YVTN family beta-propeller protein